MTGIYSFHAKNIAADDKILPLHFADSIKDIFLPSSSQRCSHVPPELLTSTLLAAHTSSPFAKFDDYSLGNRLSNSGFACVDIVLELRHFRFSPLKPKAQLSAALRSVRITTSRSLELCVGSEITFYLSTSVKQSCQLLQFFN